MKISTKGRYALRLMLEIASRPAGEPVSLKAVAQTQEMSLKYLEQIVNQLCRAGMLTSVRGPQGGYLLSRQPQEYRAGDILRVTEGSLAPVACLEDGAAFCSRWEDCATLPFWKGLQEAVVRYVDSVTLADLLPQPDKPET